MPVTVIEMVYLDAMLLNIVWPSSLSRGRGLLFNYGWITFLVMLIIVVIGCLRGGIVRPHRRSPGAPVRGREISVKLPRRGRRGALTECSQRPT